LGARLGTLPYQPGCLQDPRATARSPAPSTKAAPFRAYRRADGGNTGAQGRRARIRGDYQRLRYGWPDNPASPSAKSDWLSIACLDAVAILEIPNGCFRLGS
jgi:hypothetical protein